MKTFTLRTLIGLPPDTHHLNTILDFNMCFVNVLYYLKTGSHVFLQDYKREPHCGTALPFLFRND